MAFSKAGADRRLRRAGLCLRPAPCGPSGPRGLAPMLRPARGIHPTLLIHPFLPTHIIVQENGRSTRFLCYTTATGVITE